MLVSLATHPPSSAILATLIEAQRRVIQGVLEEGGKRPRAKRIHALRVAIRRLLAALSLTEAIGHEVRGRTPRRLRKLMTVLSPLRDLQVQQRALAPLVSVHPPVEAMLTALRARKRACARRVGRKLVAFGVADFEHDLARVTGALRGPAGDASLEHAVDAVLLGELGKRHVRIERQRRSVAASDPAALHQLRLALKDYRYALEALVPLASGGGRDLLETVMRLQDQLGHAHDAHVLWEAARDFCADLEPDAKAGLAGWLVELEQASQGSHERAVTALGAAQLGWPPLA